MQFIIIARDDKDSEALERRLAAREAHIAYSNKAAEAGEQLIAAAMLDSDDKMCGSVLVVDFESREDLEEWLKIEAYVTGNVWKDIEIIPCKLAPAFHKLIKKT